MPLIAVDTLSGRQFCVIVVNPSTGYSNDAEPVDDEAHVGEN